ncbi:MAG: CC0125/CC1285 family lipoprotein, partial [Nitrospiraceae bacterium]
MPVTLCPILFSLIFLLQGCATTRYEPLGEARGEEIEQINDNTIRVEYRVSPFTSQDALDEFLLRRCADVTLQEGYDYFSMTEKFIILSYHRSTSVTLKMFKGQKPAGSSWF